MCDSGLLTNIMTSHFHQEGSLESAVQNGNLTTLNMLATFGILPDKYAANIATQNRDTQFLLWLVEHKIVSEVTCANIAAKYGNISMLNWWLKRYVVPNHIGVAWALNNNDNDDGNVQAWLFDHDIMAM